jgi:hypothetical protein
MSIMLSLALMLSATNAPAAVDSAAPADASQSAKQAKKPKKKKPKKICRSDTQDTGSRIMKSVCKTEEEWQNEVDGREIQAKSQNY